MVPVLGRRNRLARLELATMQQVPESAQYPTVPVSGMLTVSLAGSTGTTGRPATVTKLGQDRPGSENGEGPKSCHILNAAADAVGNTIGEGGGLVHRHHMTTASRNAEYICIYIHMYTMIEQAAGGRTTRAVRPAFADGFPVWCRRSKRFFSTFVPGKRITKLA